MTFAFFVLASISQWAPMHWRSGDPESLELLEGTTVNCILIEPSNWNAASIREAHRREIAVVGLIHPDTSDPVEQAKRAAALRLDAVALEGDFEDQAIRRVRSALSDTHLQAIELARRRGVPLNRHDPVIGTWQALWPGIEVEHGGKGTSAPTSSPWINTNAGFLRFVHAATNATVWVDVAPPEKTVLRPANYAQAVGDAELAGARWIVSLDPDLEKRLLARQTEAVATWRNIARYLHYYEDHPEWRGYGPASRLGVAEDTGSGALLSAGLLDMLSSLRVEPRPIPTRQLSSESLDGIRVLLNVDAASLDEKQRKAVDRFAKAGGVVVNPPEGWRLPEAKKEGIVPDRQQANAIQAMWEGVYNATVRKNFSARTFNTPGVQSGVLASPDGKSVLVHLVNYTDYPDEAVTVHVLGAWKRARLYRPDMPVAELPVYPVPEGTGVDIDRISVLGTLRMD